LEFGPARGPPSTGRGGLSLAIASRPVSLSAATLAEVEDLTSTALGALIVPAKRLRAGGGG